MVKKRSEKMYEVLGPLCLFVMMVAALLIMFNLEAGKRLLIGVVVFALLAPLLLGLLKALLSDGI